MPKGPKYIDYEHKPDRGTLLVFGERLKEVFRKAGGVYAFADEVHATPATIYRKINDGDNCTIADLRHIRVKTGITKAELVEMIRPLL